MRTLRAPLVAAVTALVVSLPAVAQAAANGNPEGAAAVPAAGRAENVSIPTTVVGTGTPPSCTSAAVVAAVAHGGVITFDCGPSPVTIAMTATARVYNKVDGSPSGAEVHDVVIDGGGLVTLSGGGVRRILYSNTCDQPWTTSHCQDQQYPKITVQHLTFADGNASGTTDSNGNPIGGGAIYVRGGQLKVVDSRFERNRCDATGQDTAGGAINAHLMWTASPIYISDSTFGGGAGLGNSCSNGGALGSIHVSWTIVNSLFSYNEATGWGANPKRSGTPGGGNGGAISNDGNTYTLDIRGSLIEHNHAPEGGGGVFYVSNNRTGTLRIDNSVLCANPSDGFETAGYPGMFVLASGGPQVSFSRIDTTCPANAPATRIWGADRYATAAAISAWAYPAGASVAYVATGADYPDALAGGAAAAHEGGPLLLVTRDAVPGATRAELLRLAPTRIVVLGGTGVVSDAVFASLGTIAPVTRLWGRDRYATAVAVSQAAFASADTAFVTTGLAFPDAMVAAPAAQAAGAPLLLVARDSVPAAVTAELARLGVSKVRIVGGPGAVSDAVAATLAAGGREVVRYAAADRYSSAIAVSKNTFGPGVGTVLIAVGTNFPDALAGAAVSAVRPGPILLVQKGTLPSGVASELTRLSPGEVVVLGGSGVVSYPMAVTLGAY